jgi:lipopolysaccharide export system permease protein
MASDRIPIRVFTPRRNPRWVIPGYIVRETLPLYLPFVLVLTLMMLIDTLSWSIGKIIENNISLDLVLRYFINRVPFALTYAISPSLCITILLALGRMAKDSEIKALWAAGVQPAKLLWPFVGLGLLVGSLSFYNSNMLLPRASKQWEDDWYRITGSGPSDPSLTIQSYSDQKTHTLFHAGRIQVKKLGSNSSNPRDINAVAQFDENNYELSGIMIQTPKETLTARTGNWNKRAGSWELFNVFRTPHLANNASTRPNPPTSEVRLVVPFTGDASFNPFSLPPKNLYLQELLARVKSTGITVKEHFEAEFELHRRFSDPVAALLLAVLGGALGLTISNRAWAAVVVFGLLFGYWTFWTFGKSLAETQALTPILAAWLPAMVFGLASMFAVRRLW